MVDSMNKHLRLKIPTLTQHEFDVKPFYEKCIFFFLEEKIGEEEMLQIEFINDLTKLIITT